MAQSARRRNVIALSVLLMGLGAVTSASATTQSSQRWPVSIVAGNVLTTPPSVDKALPFGTVITKSQLDQTGGQKSVTYVNNVGWALGDYDHFEYPIFSSNHGVTWRVGGHWFAFPAADGAAFTSSIKAFRPQAAGHAPTAMASYFVGESTFYVTWDGGRQWHSTFMPGNVVSVTQLKSATMPSAPLQFFVVKVRSYFAPFTTRYYSSVDEGRRWTRSVEQPVAG